MLSVDAQKAAAAGREVIDRLNAMAAELGKRYTLTLSFPGRMTEEQRLTWLINGRAPHQPPRPILQFNAFAQERVAEAVRVRFAESMLAGRVPSMLPVMTVAGYALKAVYVDRFARSGGDVSLAPLSPRWLDRKRRRGLDLRIGRATGATAAAVEKAQVIVSRVK